MNIKFTIMKKAAVTFFPLILVACGDPPPEPPTPNIAPTVDAGVDQTIDISAGIITEVTLDGSGSSDPNGDQLTYTWSQVSGPDVVLSSESDAQPTFTAPSVPWDMTLTFELSVSDGEFTTGSDQVVITVRPEPVYTFSQVLEGAPWSFGQQAPGMAVNAADQVFLANGDTLWMVDGESISIYLGPDDGDFDFSDVDFDEASTIYLLDGSQGDVLTSTAAGSTMPYRSDYLPVASFMGTADVGEVLITHRDGLSLFDGADTSLVHSDTAFRGSTDCATEDLAVQRSGAFVYNPGCNGSPFVLGNTVDDATRVFHIFPTGATGEGDPVCVTRDPAGGFFAIVDFFFDGTMQLAHLDEGATASSGWEILGTASALDEAAEQSEESFAFSYCAIAASPSGRIFFQTRSQLWVFDPI